MYIGRKNRWRLKLIGWLLVSAVFVITVQPMHVHLQHTDDASSPIHEHTIDLHFAVDNIDTISAISYQPVCFTGRIDAEKRLQQRYTLGDLAHDLARAAGADVERDFYPLSIVMPLAQFLESLTGDPKIKPSSHTDCALGSYFLVSPDKQVYLLAGGTDQLADNPAYTPGLAMSGPPLTFYFASSWILSNSSISQR